MNPHPPLRDRLRAISGPLAGLLVLALGLSTLAAADPPVGYREALDRGNAALRAQDYDAAAAAFRDASALDPSDTDALLKLGMTLSRKLDHAGAEDAYKALLELAPQDVQALNNLANVYLRQDRYAEAAEYYGRAVAIQPDYVLAVFHHAWVLRQLDRPDEATQAFERCMALAPGDDRDRATQLDCRFYLGTLTFRARDFARSALLMEQVLSRIPGHPEARYYLGMSYRGLGRMGEAREQLAIHRQILDGRRRTTPIEKPTDR